MPKTPAKKTRKTVSTKIAAVTNSAPKSVVAMKSAPVRQTSGSAYSFSNFVAFLNSNFSFILLVCIFLVLGFIVGSLWTENKLSKSGISAGNTGITGGTGTAVAPAAGCS